MKLKKVFIFVFFVSILFFGLNKMHSIRANNTPIGDNLMNNYNQMGRTINVFNSTYGDVYDFNRSKDVIIRNSINPNMIDIDNVLSSYERISSGNSSSEFTNDLKSELTSRMSVTLPIDVFTLSAKNHFNFGFDTTESRYATSFYYNHNFIRSNYILSIKNPKNTLSSVTLTDEFLSDIITFESTLGNQEYEQRHFMRNLLLKKYDTHFVTGAEFGGDLSLNYSAHSNSISFKTSISGGAETLANASITGGVYGGDVSVSSSFRNVITQEDSMSNVTFFARTRGGDINYDSDDESNYISNYNSWKSTIENKEVLINYTDLLPIWDVLPNYYYFDKYGTINLTLYKRIAREEYNKLLKERETITTNNNIPIITSYSDNVPQNYKITDDHHLSQNNYVRFNLTHNLYGPKLALIEEKGFNNISLTVNFDAREISDGYQYLTLYTTDQEGNRLDYLTEMRFELTPGKKQSSWSNESYSFNLPISSFTYSGYKDSPRILIYFSASGTGNDDWEIKNINYSSTLNKN